MRIEGIMSQQKIYFSVITPTDFLVSLIFFSLPDWQSNSSLWSVQSTSPSHLKVMGMQASKGKLQAPPLPLCKDLQTPLTHLNSSS